MGKPYPHPLPNPPLKGEGNDIMGKLKSYKGQTVVPEYVVGFLLVIAAMVAVTVYLQRAFQARARDAKIYMVDTAAKGCGQDCKAATGGKIAYEYEPYYTQINSIVERDQDDRKQDLLTGIFKKQVSQTTRVDSMSKQLPPKEAN